MEGRSPKRFTGPGYYTFEHDGDDAPVVWTMFYELDEKAPYGMVAMKNRSTDPVVYWMSSRIFDEDCRS